MTPGTTSCTLTYNNIWYLLPTLEGKPDEDKASRSLVNDNASTG